MKVLALDVLPTAMPALIPFPAHLAQVDMGLPRVGALPIASTQPSLQLPVEIKLAILPAMQIVPDVMGPHHTSASLALLE